MRGEHLVQRVVGGAQHKHRRRTPLAQRRRRRLLCLLIRLLLRLLWHREVVGLWTKGHWVEVRTLLPSPRLGRTLRLPTSPR